MPCWVQVTCAHLLNVPNHYLTIIFIYFFLHQHPEGIWYDPSQKETIASSSSVEPQVLLLHVFVGEGGEGGGEGRREEGRRGALVHELRNTQPLQ